VFATGRVAVRTRPVASQRSGQHSEAEECRCRRSGCNPGKDGNEHSRSGRGAETSSFKRFKSARGDAARRQQGGRDDPANNRESAPDTPQWPADQGALRLVLTPRRRWSMRGGCSFSQTFATVARFWLIARRYVASRASARSVQRSQAAEAPVAAVQCTITRTLPFHRSASGSAVPHVRGKCT
jgi:hypothetical protein